jgi:predicted AlkP superfamily phosphohydrolase/phosphomutase
MIYFQRFQNHRHIKYLLYLLFMFFISCSEKPVTNKKVLVLGFDGVPYGPLKELMEQGKLPNFSRLAEQGGFRALTTSIPPQSPVAWSSFITGQNPGKTDIYDFIARKPETYMPYLSTSSVEGESKGFTIGNWIIPLSSPQPVLLRRGRAFWQYLEEKDIPTVVLKVPANYPPLETKGRSLAGMGTPDILGTYGTFTFYTTKPQEKKKETGGRVVKVTKEGNRIETRLSGPPNSFRVDQAEVGIDLTIHVDPQNSVARVDLGDQAQVLLQKGEWSDWTPLTFELIPYYPFEGGTMSLICKFFLKEVHPDFEMYVTPLNIDPAKPFMPITTPASYSQELAEKFGPFYTQGMPEDTWALNEGRLNDKQFLQQVRFIQDEKRKIFFYEFDRFDSGFLFCHFFAFDQLSHMFWRFIDPQHPGYKEDKAGHFKKVIENTYLELDEILGEVLDRIDQKTTLVVLSDHGFAPFRRFFHLNTWLYENGYIVLMDEARTTSEEFFENVDWSRTRAYAMGLNSLYLNIYGREGEGIVERGEEAETLKKELIQGLKQIKDPETGMQVIKEVYDTERVYSGAHVKTAPDLIVGYNRNYRSSWETALGKITESVFGDNLKAWSGDHCMAIDLVPGILLTNKKITMEKPALIDLAPSILAEFGISEPEDMDGKSFFH